MVKFAIVAALLSSCGYGGQLNNCAISCANAGPCPSGFTCSSMEGLCHAAGALSCGAVLDATADSPGGDAARDGAHGSDGAVASDASTVDAGSHDAFLSEGSGSGVTESAAGCASVPINDCPSNLTESGIQAGIAWYREFALPDFAGAPWDVTGGFQITKVHFGCSSSSANENVKITVYGYTGALFGATLDTTKLTQLGSGSSATIGAATCTGDIAVAVSVPAITPGSAFVVKISANDTYSDDMGNCGITAAFRLGANSAGESRGSYTDNYCGDGSATLWTTNDAVIAVEGTAQ